ncbi:epithelial-stromal interaction protein 1 [Gadus morhua]|uniref:Epithelial stromal interaction 1 n=1 Tax=Gadus morhua TaxID=8049 RepID=A0A8C5BVB5_GADMO|nr:epithelial-stromal interaction protein 1 [Gadus morhua]
MDSDPNYQNNLNGRGNPDNGAVNRQNNANDVVSPDNGSGNARDTETFTGFTRVAPNETRRRQLQNMAQKEEADFQKYRESLKPVTIDEPPELLGGGVSLAEARRRQQTQLDQSRIQKRMKKMELDRRRRAEEEEENQRLKDEQRQKAEQYERRSKQQEQKRSQQLRQEHCRVTETFLQKLQGEGSSPASSSSGSQTHALHGGGEENEWWRGPESSGLHLKKKEQTLPVPRGQTLQDDPRVRAMGSGQEQADHRKLNSAFLDRLENRGRADDALAFRDSESWESQRPEPPQCSVAHTTPDAPQSDAEWPELAADLEAEFDWAVQKLKVTFPECNRRFLEDILNQCDGDCQQAAALLHETMS